MTRASADVVRDAAATGDAARKDATRKGAGLLGITAAACIACCAGPILGVLGGIGLAGLVGAAFVGDAGLVITAAAIAAIVVVRRRRAAGVACAAPVDGRVPVAAPTRRPPTTPLEAQ